MSERSTSELRPAPCGIEPKSKYVCISLGAIILDGLPKSKRDLYLGQVKSECLTCTFRATCCSACLSRAQTGLPAFAGSSVRDRICRPRISPIQFNSVLTCTFRASCYSARLSWAHTPVINWVVCLGQMVSS